VKRVGLLLASIALVLFIAGGVALAAVINGTAGDDTLTGTQKADSIYGHGGNDTITGKAGADEIWGGTGSDVIKGNGDDNTLHGEGGNDNLYGGIDDDELRGGDGVDILTGAGGNDRLYDRNGNTAERDEFYCGAGQDTVSADATDFVSSSCETVNGDGGPDVLPDLGMARIANVQIETTSGRKLLRFSTTIVNVGAGNFEVTGRRPDTSTTDMTVTQRIYDSAGGYRDRSTNATFFYSGDGHNHWHVRDLEDYELFRSGDGGFVAAGEKMGFCFYDNVEYGATTDPYYGPGCANGQPNALSVTMGLQRGWGDLYPASTVGQYIDITDVPDGEYRLRITADGTDRFLEEDETNNVTWADLRITGTTVQVLAYGPVAPPIS